jgi:poly(3-hydroxybutyrate) depolymerase
LIRLRPGSRFRNALSLARLRSALPAGTGAGTPSRRPRHPARFVVLAWAAAIAGCAEPDAPLPALKIDATRVSVSGISSGAYMAHQVHLAFSSTIDGAALIAGGPYGCAQGDLHTALSNCMHPERAPELAPLIDVVRARATAGQIDALSGLEGDRVWVLHGRADQRVSAAVTAASAELYRASSPQVSVTFDGERDIGHVFATAEKGDCRADDAHLAACGVDLAGEIFKQVVDAAAQPATRAQGELLAFGQRAFAEDGHDPLLADRGYVYVPPQCREQSCGLHVAFHGCEMQADRIGTRFVADAGYNRWADGAGVVVLYPQARSSLMPLNPKACWDWWGYTGRDHDTRDGAQPRWLKRVFARFGIAV